MDNRTTSTRLRQIGVEPSCLHRVRRILRPTVKWPVAIWKHMVESVDVLTNRAISAKWLPSSRSRRDAPRFPRTTSRHCSFCGDASNLRIHVVAIGFVRLVPSCSITGCSRSAYSRVEPFRTHLFTCPLINPRSRKRKVRKQASSHAAKITSTNFGPVQSPAWACRYRHTL